MPLAFNFIKKETPTQVFSYEYCEIIMNSFLQNTSTCCFCTDDEAWKNVS